MTNPFRPVGLVSLCFAAAAACASPAPPPPASPAHTTTSSAVAAGARATVDPALQRIADDELARLVHDWAPASAAILVLDAATGEVRADAGRSGGAPADVAVTGAFLTGSTIKAITLAAALEEGVLTPTETIDCGGGALAYDGETIQDVSPNGRLDGSAMLAVSSNVGVVKVFDRLGGAPLARWLRAFHFGLAPDVAGAAAGDSPAQIADHSFAGARAAIGLGVEASPLQVAAAYAVIANGGAYVAPTFTARAAPSEAVIPILKPETARALTSMLEEAVNGERAHGKLARIPGLRVAGKTGTATWNRPDGTQGDYASFVGFVPHASPPLVVVVGAEQPRHEHDDAGGATVAAPVFARVMSRALATLGTGRPQKP